MLALLSLLGNSILLHVNKVLLLCSVSTFVGNIDNFPNNQNYSRCMYLWAAKMSACMCSPTMLLFRESSQIPYLHCDLYLPSACLFATTLVFVHWSFALEVKHGNDDLSFISFEFVLKIFTYSNGFDEVIVSMNSVQS